MWYVKCVKCGTWPPQNFTGKKITAELLIKRVYVLSSVIIPIDKYYCSHNIMPTHHGNAHIHKSESV